MNKIYAFLLTVFLIPGLNAQNYKISFTGSGESLSIDSVKVLNLNQGTTLTLNSSDVLNLVKTNTDIQTQLPLESELCIYPNPAGETSKIEFYNSKKGNVIIEIFESTGKIIIRKSMQLVQGNQIFNISVKNSGIYLVNVRTPDKAFSGKLISNFENSGNTSIEYVAGNFTIKPKYTLKSNQNLVLMQYNDGERILFKGISDSYARVLTLIPTKDSTVNFEFIECTDVDNNHYAVVTIGTQTWMAENLKTTKYNGGTAIPLVTDNTTWVYLTSPGYCWYNNDSATYAQTYGALYNWYTVNAGNLCPTDWHVPADEDWITLTNYLTNYGFGYEGVGDRIAKSMAASSGWKTSLTAGEVGNDQSSNNSSGFTALPGGYRAEGGAFASNGLHGFFWSSTEFWSGESMGRGVTYFSSTVSANRFYNHYGFSVRCVKD